MTKILAKKIVLLYTIFFSKIVYLYRFKQYIFEYRCPTLLTKLFLSSSSNTKLFLTSHFTKLMLTLSNCFLPHQEVCQRDKLFLTSQSWSPLGCVLTFASEAKFEIEAKISFRLEARFHIIHFDAKHHKSEAKTNVK